MQNCTTAYLNRCCELSNTDITAPFNTTEKENLRRDCLEKAISSSCKVPPQQKLIGSINDVSLLVTVNYTCDNEDPPPDARTPDVHQPLTDTEDTNTAAIVVPIVVVFVIVGITAVVLYWRRKQRIENGRKHEGQADFNGQAPVQNPGYIDTDTVTESSKDIKDCDLDAEDTYHTIDPSSIPDRAPAVPNEYLVLDPPEDEYNTIDPNNVDTKTGTSNEYFILELGAQNTYNEASNSKDCDYNKINLKEHEIVKDPKYQRLAAVGENPKAESNADNENYSHLGDKVVDKAKGGETEAGDIKNDDYAHLNTHSI